MLSLTKYTMSSVIFLCEQEPSVWSGSGDQILPQVPRAQRATGDKTQSKCVINELVAVCARDVLKSRKKKWRSFNLYQLD